MKAFFSVVLTRYMLHSVCYYTTQWPKVEADLEDVTDYD